MTRLEHANITVSNPAKTAAMLGDIFGWHIRWEGAGMNGAGTTIHVGVDDSYLALYASHDTQQIAEPDASYHTRGGLNHIGIVVDNLDKIEEKVKAAGFVPQSHANYEPGRRFYFDDADGIEFEVICYD